VPATSRKAPPVEHVPELTTNRLSVYLRCLDALDTAGQRTVSSRALADRCLVNAAQVRKDLAYFGEFGVRGVGYTVADLRGHLRQILGLDRRRRMVIVGAGNLGMALADYAGFRDQGFDTVALLDTARHKVGTRSRTGIEVHHASELAEVVAREDVSVGVVAVPAAAAQETVEALVAVGVRAILDFAPPPVRTPPGVKVKHVDLAVSLESLSFFLAAEHHEQTPAPQP